MLAPGLAPVTADEDAIAWIGEGTIQWGFVLLIIGADVVLEGDHDAAVFANDVLADEGTFLEAARHFDRLAPCLEGVVTGEVPGTPVIGPVLGVRGEKQRAALAEDHELRRALADGFSFAREADIEPLQRCPNLAQVMAARHAGVVQRAWLGIATGEDKENP